MRERHGHSKPSTPEYDAFHSARQRCNNPNATHYEAYGGRGIKFLFESFPQFLKCVGPRPGPEYSIDRFPDKNGNYEPGNVRWATRKQQQRNMRSNRMLTLNGETRPLTEWAEIRGLKPCTVDSRLRKGESVEVALRTTLDKGNPKRNVEVNGLAASAAEIAASSGLPYGTVYARLRSGWTIDRIVSTKPRSSTWTDLSSAAVVHVSVSGKRNRGIRTECRNCQEKFVSRLNRDGTPAFKFCCHKCHGAYNSMKRIAEGLLAA
jgi:hypothetical protein